MNIIKAFKTRGVTLASPAADGSPLLQAFVTCAAAVEAKLCHAASPVRLSLASPVTDDSPFLLASFICAAAIEAKLRHAASPSMPSLKASPAAAAFTVRTAALALGHMSARSLLADYFQGLGSGNNSGPSETGKGRDGPDLLSGPTQLNITSGLDRFHDGPNFSDRKNPSSGPGLV
jgi:hypothetical protein